MGGVKEEVALNEVHSEIVLPSVAVPTRKPKRSPTAFQLFRDDGVLFMPLHMSTTHKHEELEKRFEDLCNSKRHRHLLDKYFNKAEELFLLYLDEYAYWEEMKDKTKEHAKKMKASKAMKSSKPMKAIDTTKLMKRSKLLPSSPSAFRKLFWVSLYMVWDLALRGYPFDWQKPPPKLANSSSSVEVM